MGVRRDPGSGRFEPSPAVALADALDALVPAEPDAGRSVVIAEPFPVDPAWDRWPEETEKAFVAFEAYRTLTPPRSLPRACAALHRPSGYVRSLHSWSRQHRWPERVDVWDAHLRSLAISARETEARQLGGRLREIAEDITAIVRRSTARWLADPTFDPSPREAEVLARLAHRILGPEMKAGEADDRDPASLLADADEASDPLK